MPGESPTENTVSVKLVLSLAVPASAPLIYCLTFPEPVPFLTTAT